MMKHVIYKHFLSLLRSLSARWQSPQSASSQEPREAALAQATDLAHLEYLEKSYTRNEGSFFRRGAL